MPNQPEAPTPELKVSREFCDHHGIMEELRLYVYDHVPKLTDKVGNIWATISVVALFAGTIVGILLWNVSETRSEVKKEQVHHKKETTLQLLEMNNLVKTIVKSTKAQELSALATEKNVAVFMERYSVLQEQNRREIEELNRLTEQNHRDIEKLSRYRWAPPKPQEES